MLKIQFILTLCYLSQAAYINRLANVNRVRAPTPFRPGVALHRMWTHPRVVHAASNRSPYILYRNSPHRFPIKQYPVPSRHLYKGPWKTTAKLPQLSISTTEYEFMRAASAPPVSHIDGGAIHTIPAPNLSLSEKPIVVLDTSVDNAGNTASEVPKPTYEVTEEYPEVVYPLPKLERPIGFSKITALTTPKLQSLIGSGTPFQLSPDYELSSLNINESPALQQEYTIQGFSGLPTPQDLRNSGAEGLIIPPNALYQSDPMFVQKLQTHLLHQFPAVEFIPYAANSPQIQIQPGPSLQHQPIILLEEEDLKQEPSSFVPSIEKNVVQRQTQESVVTNITEKPWITPSQLDNITIELVANDQPITTTIKYIIENKTEENTTPIYYAQIGQSVGNLVAKTFYAAMNEAKNEDRDKLEQKTKQPTASKEEITTTATDVLEIKTSIQDLKENRTAELNSLHNIPFRKSVDAVNVTYALFTAPKETKALHPTPNSDDKGARKLSDEVYAGQIVEATISEDHDFNKQKASLVLKRAPIRLLAISNIKAITTEAPKVTSANAVPKVAVVKPKTQPKSKLMYDDKTGQPVLRIYASSYLNNSTNSKAADNIKREKESVPVTKAFENWKSSTVQSVDKTQGFEANQITGFGLKLRLRRDDNVPIFEDFEK